MVTRLGRAGVSYCKLLRLRCAYRRSPARLLTTCGARQHEQQQDDHTHSQEDHIHSSYQPRQRCEKLQSLHAEFHITSLIDAYLALGKVREAEPIFNRYRRDGHHFEADVYNQLIFGWADAKKEFHAVKLFHSMKEDGIPPNYQTYAAMLYTYNKCGELTAIQATIDEMKEKGFMPEYLVHTTQLNRSQAAEVHQVLCRHGISVKAPPCPEPRYPRVVQPLYSEGQTDSLALQSQELHHLPQMFNTATLNRRMRKQFKIELQGFESVSSIATVSKEERRESSVKSTLHQLKQRWRNALAEALSSDIDDFHAVLDILSKSASRLSGPKFFPFLGLLPAQTWADIVMEEVVMLLLQQPHGVPVKYLCRQIGESAWNKYIILMKEKTGALDKIKWMYEKYMAFLSSPAAVHETSREFWTELERSNPLRGTSVMDSSQWPMTVFIHVGGFLLTRLAETATIPGHFKKQHADEPALAAFQHFYEQVGYKSVGHMKPHQKLSAAMKKLFSKNEAVSFKLNATLLPMLVPPRPWTDVGEGGYFVTPGCVVRCYVDTYQHQLLLKDSDNLRAIYDALNYLSSCPWAINGRVLDLVTAVFNGGGDEALDVPVLRPTVTEEDSENLTQWQRRLNKKLHNESYSLWMDMLYRLSLGNHYRKEVFWLPYNMDFRGRVYPIPPLLSHLTGDVGRSILKLGVGYPLGKRGLDWLKIHVVNLHGEKKKSSLAGRLEFANEKLADIMDSADRPMDGRKWWQSGDSPWQVLACCMEITDAIRSHDPECFVSHIPVHQDGSCNGLQHYAALGRDTLGAKQVNLLPQERPEDPYLGVALRVEEKRKCDAENEVEAAVILDGKIHRKVVKQTVMTVVYGVTYVGGRQQIEKQLRDHIPDDKLWDCSMYVVVAVFEVLREMFSNARNIQDWLAESARTVALLGHPMEWKTPLGLPVVQPYHRPIAKELKTRLQGITQTNYNDRSRPPDTKKQKNAMPPNFIHSLDSTHMMLTALHAQRVGISFVAVHDSFWTHPCFVDTMSKICREQFVALHNEPILADLGEFWEQKFGGREYIDSRMPRDERKMKSSFQDKCPSTGNLDLTQVHKSTYFFS